MCRLVLKSSPDLRPKGLILDLLALASKAKIADKYHCAFRTFSGFGVRFSLCSPGYLGTQYVDEIGL